MRDLPTIQLITGRILRDNPSLRTTDKREAVWNKVRETIPNAPYERVARSCRHIQNTLKMHLPDHDDHRHEQAEQYRNYYGEI